jgi:hypothetical protein
MASNNNLLSDYNNEELVAALTEGRNILYDLAKSRVTDEMREAAVGSQSQGNYCAMKYIGFEDTPRYREFALTACMQNSGNIPYLSPNIIDTSFIAEISRDGGYTPGLLFRHFSNAVNIALDHLDSLKPIFLSTSSLLMIVKYWADGKIQSPFLTAEFFAERISSYGIFADAFYKTRWENLLLNSIKSGGWPDNITKPDSLKSAVKMAMTVNSSLQQKWYLAYIKTHPIEEVVKHMNTDARLDALNKMYTREELLPHLAKNTKARVKWLEDDLGL